jgi:hypothetical protein
MFVSRPVGMALNVPAWLIASPCGGQWEALH